MGVLEKLVTVGTAAVTCGCAQGSRVCALIAGHCSGPGEIISQEYCWTSLLPLWAPTACHIPDEQRSAFSSWDLWFMPWKSRVY